MNGRSPKRGTPLSGGAALLPRAAAVAVAAVAGAAAGAFAAWKIPAERFVWTGIALVPLFALIEMFVGRAAALFGGDENAARLWLAGTVVAGFYAAWFVARPA
jgi:uncharacterized membrane protein YfcA